MEKEKFKEEEALGYDIEIVGRNVDVTEPIRTYFWKKIAKIERFHTHILFMHVVLELQKLEHVCTIVMRFDGLKIKVSASGTDLYASIDQAIDKLQVLCLRYKSRIQDYHKKKLSDVDMVVNVVHKPYDEVAEINAAIEEETLRQEIETYAPHTVIATEKKPLKILTMDEAIMRMELSNDPFLLYRSEEDNKLKLIYRRSDDNYGIIQPE